MKDFFTWQAIGYGAMIALCLVLVIGPMVTK